MNKWVTLLFCALLTLCGVASFFCGKEYAESQEKKESSYGLGVFDLCMYIKGADLKSAENTPELDRTGYVLECTQVVNFIEEYYGWNGK